MTSQSVIIEFADGTVAKFRGPPQVNTDKIPKIRRVRFTKPKRDFEMPEFFDKIFNKRENEND